MISIPFAFAINFIVGLCTRKRVPTFESEIVKYYPILARIHAPIKIN